MIGSPSLLRMVKRVSGLTALLGRVGDLLHSIDIALRHVGYASNVQDAVAAALRVEVDVVPQVLAEHSCFSHFEGLDVHDMLVTAS